MRFEAEDYGEEEMENPRELHMYTSDNSDSVRKESLRRKNQNGLRASEAESMQTMDLSQNSIINNTR